MFTFVERRRQDAFLFSPKYIIKCFCVFFCQITQSVFFVSPGKVFSVEMSDSTAERYHWSVYIHTIQYHAIPQPVNNTTQCLIEIPYNTCTMPHNTIQCLIEKALVCQQYLYNITQYRPILYNTIQHLYNITQYHPMSDRDSTVPSTTPRLH